MQAHRRNRDPKLLYGLSCRTVECCDTIHNLACIALNASLPFVLDLYLFDFSNLVSFTRAQILLDYVHLHLKREGVFEVSHLDAKKRLNSAWRGSNFLDAPSVVGKQFREPLEQLI